MSSNTNWDAQGFWAALNRCIEARGSSLTQVRDITGLSAITVTRMKSGKRPDAASLAALCSWSGINPAQFTLSEPAAATIKFGADRMADAIDAMVKAKVEGDDKRYAVHEGAMREQLRALEQELKVAGREIRFK